MTDPLPIDAMLPALMAALEAGPNAVLAAPPGAGKTTRVPLALLDGAGWLGAGRILMLEPRRIAARAAAERLAAQLGERPGVRVGYRIRGESRVGRDTRIEVVTEGVLTRMLQSDPELPGIAALLFDEVHERSLQTDLGLALALEVQEALRPELRLLAMSATLDTGRFSTLLGGAPVIESAGRLFPVTTHWLERPRKAGQPTQPGRQDRAHITAIVNLVTRALAETEGDLLVFLPGAGEIARAEEALGRAHPELALCPLYGALPFVRQRAALAPDPQGRRRAVLATAIAETSLTVDGVRVVVDGGLARRARVNPASGMGRLVTTPVSRAEAEQRRGRAGRLAPGHCYRLWTRAEEGALPAEAPPEILEADLVPLALELAAWGVEPKALRFLDAPPDGALAEARRLLVYLDALDGDGRITAHGRDLVTRPLHPRLAHMLARAEEDGLGAEAALLAGLLGERDPLGPGAGADLGPRLAALTGRPGPTADRAALERIRAEARRLHKGRADPERLLRHAGGLLSLAYPDRVALRRPGEEPRYLLSGGRGAVLGAEDALAGHRLVVAAEVEDSGREGRIRLAAPLAESDLRARHGAAIAWHDSVRWEPREARVRARRQERFGVLVLADRIWRKAPPDRLGAALADGVRAGGIAALPWSKAALRLRARVGWLRSQSGPLAERLPDWSDTGLLATLSDWLEPHLAGLSTLDQIPSDLTGQLRDQLPWDLTADLDRAAPEGLKTPLGSIAPIDYGRAEPTVSVRVQEMFGTTAHPSVGAPPVALAVELLSPAGRPVQTTRDLPRFWASPAYRDMVKEMRARYPRHPWPDDPAAAPPTRRARPRGT
ncbi:MAG: ATP-dependent helicase HrpB [Pseudomonadota bacterium]